MNIALLTCSKLPQLTAADQLLIPELEKHGLSAEAVIWDDDTVDWAKYDCLIFRNTWDYYEKEDQFNNWLNKIKVLKINIFNTSEIIHQNKHKFYLRELQNQGIKIIPTIFIDSTNNLKLHKILPVDWDKAVIKPAFSAGSYLTEVFEAKHVEQINTVYQPIAKKKDLLLQKFIPEIQWLGETSFIFFNKEFSHCINKKPINGDFRVQVQFGGKYTAIHPSQALIDKAKRIVDTFSQPLLYARVDGIVINDDLLLMEIECIEPDLYFDLCEGSIQRFVSSILELI